MPQAAPTAGVTHPPFVTIRELEADPHGAFRRYRAVSPVIQREDGGYLILRAEDCDRLLKDDRFCQPGGAFMTLRGIDSGMLLTIFEQTMLTSNGAAHRNRRSPFSRAFALRIIAALRPRIRQAAYNLLDDWQEPEIDFVDRFAALLPAQLISEMLGLAKEDVPHFSQCVEQVTRALGFSFGPEDIPDIEQAAQDLYAYVDRVLDSRRGTPSDDFLSRFLADVDSEGNLSAQDAIIQVLTVIVGGTDTTRVAMGSLVGLLLGQRPLWDAVGNDSGLISGAVNEALRYEPSVGSVSRLTTEDVMVGDFTIPARSFVTFSTMSAMRDEQVYQHPDTFDIQRNDHPRLHPVFGAGPHRCLGEALARAELEEGLAALFDRVPHLRLVEGMPEVSGHVSIRRIGAMPVRWR